jgi:hypothetical protein
VSSAATGTMSSAGASGDRVQLAYVAEVDGERVPETGEHEIAPTLGKLERLSGTGRGS